MGMITLAENLVYIESHKDGCLLYSECLECPLERCLFDENYIRQVKRHRDEEIIKEYKKGKGAKEISKEYNLSQRTVVRVLKGFKWQG